MFRTRQTLTAVLAGFRHVLSVMKFEICSLGVIMRKFSAFTLITALVSLNKHITLT